MPRLSFLFPLHCCAGQTSIILPFLKSEWFDYKSLSTVFNFCLELWNYTGEIQEIEGVKNWKSQLKGQSGPWAREQNPGFHFSLFAFPRDLRGGPTSS